MSLKERESRNEAVTVEIETEQDAYRKRACDVCLNILTLPKIVGTESMRAGAESLLVELMHGEERKRFGKRKQM